MSTILKDFITRAIGYVQPVARYDANPTQMTNGDTVPFSCDEFGNLRVTGSTGSSTPSSSTSTAVGGGSSSYSNLQGDFTATPVAGTKNITISNISSNLTSLSAINFASGSIRRISSAGDSDVLPLTNVVYSNGTLTLANMTASFASGDVVQVTIIGIDKSYNTATNTDRVDMATQIAGEDVTNDVMKTEHRFTGKVFTASGIVKSGSGILHSLTFACNDAAPTAGSINFYDNTSATGTLLYSETFTTTPFRGYTVNLDVTFSNGLYVNFVTTNDVNVIPSYR